MLQTVSFFRASVLNSSYSAFKLVRASHKNIDFATRVISAKNENAHVRLVKLSYNSTDYCDTLLKIKKYDSYLNKIDFIECGGRNIYCLDYSTSSMRSGFNNMKY